MNSPSKKDLEAAEEWLSLEGIEDELLEPVELVEEDIEKTIIGLGIKHYEDPYEGTVSRRGAIKGYKLG